MLLIGQTSVLWHQTHTELHHAGEFCNYCVQSADLHSPSNPSATPFVIVNIDHAVAIHYSQQAFIAPLIRPRQGRAPPDVS
jgi:hypothetical protein